MSREPVTLLSKADIEKMREIGKIAAEMLHMLGEKAQPGVSTHELDELAVAWTKKRNLTNGPFGYHGFPRSICTSVNDCVCHGIPTKDQVLKDGDIINIDVTPIKDGYYGDTSRTFYVGTPSAEAKKLVEDTYECLMLGMAEVAPGKRIGDIGAAIQEYAEARGYGVVRDFVGHGIGRTFHTAPQVPHYGRRGKGTRMQAGMCFTIEPMINLGMWEVEVLDDGWTALTADRKLSAQFEHTLVVTNDGYEVMTQLPGASFPLRP